MEEKFEVKSREIVACPSVFCLLHKREMSVGVLKRSSQFQECRFNIAIFNQWKVQETSRGEKQYLLRIINLDKNITYWPCIPVL